MILMLKANQTFLNALMVMRFKFFHDILNFILTLAPGGEFLCAECFQFSLIFTE